MNPIALGIRPIQLDNPLEQATRAMSLKQMMQQSRAFDDKQAEDEAVKQEVAAANGDPNIAFRNLMAKGHTSAAMTLGKYLSEERKSGLETNKVKSELQSKLAGGFLSLPPEQRAAQYPQFIQQWNSNGLWGPQGPGTVPNLPWDEKFAEGLAMFANQGLSAKEALAENQSYPRQTTTMQGMTSGPTPIAAEDTGMQPQDFGKFTIPEGAKTMADVVPYLSRDQELAAAEGKVVAYPGADGRLNIDNPHVAGERQTAMTTGKIAAPPADTKAKRPAITADELRRQAEMEWQAGGTTRRDNAIKLMQRADDIEKRDIELQKFNAEKSELGKINQADYTPESFAEYMKTKDRTALRVNPKQTREAGAANINAAGGNIELGRAGMTKVDEGLLDATARKSRLTNIQKGFRPEFLETPTRLGIAWDTFKERLGGNLNTKDKKIMTDFYVFKKDSLNEVSQYIKEITGSAMSIQEADRIRSILPDAGDSWYSGDSPTQFKAGLERAIRDIKTAEARLVYIKRNGISMESVPLERMPEIMNQRGAELEKIVMQKYPNISPEDMRNTVKRQLAQEFGLTAD